MIIQVKDSNIEQAAYIHSVSWQDSHRAFCRADFVAIHTPARQEKYIRIKIERGSKFYMIYEKPLGTATSQASKDTSVLTGAAPADGISPAPEPSPEALPGDNLGASPVGLVSVTGNLIEDLYILPTFQRQGYGTALLHYAIGKCTGIPTLWILENNKVAEEMYTKNGFKKTGRRNVVDKGLDEIEFSRED